MTFIQPRGTRIYDNSHRFDNEDNSNYNGYGIMSSTLEGSSFVKNL